MATVFSFINLSTAAALGIPRQIGNNNSIRSIFKPSFTPTFTRSIFASKLRVSSSTSIPVISQILLYAVLHAPLEFGQISSKFELPISIPEDSAPGSNFHVAPIGSHSGNKTHLDLTVGGGAKVYGEPMPASTELFRCLSFLAVFMTSTRV
ncbi:hypothetical protein LguiA_006391 [Lonicera macranthoides]